MNRKEHWNQVYETKGDNDISWYQAKPAISLRLIEAAGVSKGEPIVDIGSGTSMLVDCLLDAGFKFTYPEWAQASRDLCERWKTGAMSFR